MLRPPYSLKSKLTAGGWTSGHTHKWCHSALTTSMDRSWNCSLKTWLRQLLANDGDRNCVSSPEKEIFKMWKTVINTRIKIKNSCMTKHTSVKIRECTDWNSGLIPIKWFILFLYSPFLFVKQRYHYKKIWMRQKRFLGWFMIPKFQVMF